MNKIKSFNNFEVNEISSVLKHAAFLKASDNYEKSRNNEISRIKSFRQVKKFLEVSPVLKNQFKNVIEEIFGNNLSINIDKGYFEPENEYYLKINISLTDLESNIRINLTNKNEEISFEGVNKDKLKDILYNDVNYRKFNRIINLFKTKELFKKLD